MPEDKVIRRINWVNSILGESARKMVVTNNIVKVESNAAPKASNNAPVAEEPVVAQAAPKQTEQKKTSTITQPEQTTNTQAKQTTDPNVPVACTCSSIGRTCRVCWFPWCLANEQSTWG